MAERASLQPVSDSAVSGAEVSRGWKVALACIGLIVVTAVLFLPTTSSLFELWSDANRTTYTHGYIVAFVCLWLLSRERTYLASLPFDPSWVGGIAFLAVSLLWTILERANIEAGHQILFPFLIWSAIYAVCGKLIALRVAFSCGFLIFAIPVWDVINSLLQSLTVAAESVLLALSGIPAYIEGNTVHLAAGVFEVAGGCSGLHFFIVGLAIAALQGEIGRDNWKVRAQLLLIGFGLSIFTNWLRVYIIIVAGYLTEMRHYLVSVEHYRFGWVVFAGVLVVFFFIARRLPASSPAEPMKIRTHGEISYSRLAFGLACMGVVPAYALLVPVQANTTDAGVTLPSDLVGWSGPHASDASAWAPQYPGADRIERGAYLADVGGRVEVFIATYAVQKQNKELIGYGNSLVGGNVSVLAHKRLDGEQSEMLIEDERGRALIRYGFKIGEVRTSRTVLAQLWYGVASMWSAPLSQIVAVRSSCEPDCEQARRRLDEFSEAAQGRVTRPTDSLRGQLAHGRAVG